MPLNWAKENKCFSANSADLIRLWEVCGGKLFPEVSSSLRREKRSGCQVTFSFSWSGLLSGKRVMLHLVIPVFLPLPVNEGCGSGEHIHSQKRNRNMYPVGR